MNRTPKTEKPKIHGFEKKGGEVNDKPTKSIMTNSGGKNKPRPTGKKKDLMGKETMVDTSWGA